MKNNTPPSDVGGGEKLSQALKAALLDGLGLATFFAALAFWAIAAGLFFPIWVANVTMDLFAGIGVSPGWTGGFGFLACMVAFAIVSGLTYGVMDSLVGRDA